MAMIKQIFNALWRGLWPFIIVVIMVVLSAVIYWHHQVRYPSTADAVLFNDVVSLSPNVSGTVTAVMVKQDQLVHKGDLLFSIDARLYQIALQQAQNQGVMARQTLMQNQAAVLTAKAHLVSTTSNLNLQQTQYDRKLQLFNTGAVAANEMDVAKQALQAAQANQQVAEAAVTSAEARVGDPNHNTAIEQANLAIAQAELNLSYTQVKAPVSGYLTNVNLTPGQYVAAGTVLFGIAENGVWHIHADILEPFLEKVRVGQLVRFRLLMYPGRSYEGVVSGIGYGVHIDGWQNNQALPQVAPSFDWISVAKRFPIMIEVTSPHDQTQTPFRIGASVALNIDTTRLAAGS